MRVKNKKYGTTNETNVHTIFLISSSNFWLFIIILILFDDSVKEFHSPVCIKHFNHGRTGLKQY